MFLSCTSLLLFFHKHPRAFTSSLFVIFLKLHPGCRGLCALTAFTSPLVNKHDSVVLHYCSHSLHLPTYSCFSSPWLALTSSSDSNRTMPMKRRCTVLPSMAILGWCGFFWRSWRTPPWGTISLRLRWTWPLCTAASRWSSCCSPPTPTCSAATPRSTHRCIWHHGTDTCQWWRCS